MHAHTARSSLIALLFLALATTACAAAPADPADLGRSESLLSAAQRRARAGQIRDAAAANGITQGYLLAGIAEAETHLAQCHSEATWACRGPYSADCGGPVIAGSGDGACSHRAGGLGMFQFDAGNYDDTLRREGTRILTVEGNVAAAVDFVAAMVVRSTHISGVSDRAQAIAWMNGVRVGNERWDAWISTVTHYYNGCTPGSRCWSSRYARYRDLTVSIRNEMGASFWDVGVSARRCDGVAVIDEHGGRGDCGAFGAHCVDDAIGVRCVFDACPARGADTICLDDRTLGNCHDGALGTGDCGAFGARCVDDSLGARCAFGACPARGERTICLDDHTLGSCRDGSITRGGDCSAFGARCADGPEGAHCAFYACPDTGEVDVCLDQRTIAHCNDGRVTTGDCGAFAAVCSTEGTARTAARCVSLFCVDEPGDAPVAHDTCLPDGRIAHCDENGAPLRPRACGAGTTCTTFTNADGTDGARCAGTDGSV